MKRPFALVFESEVEGGFTVTVPALPGCITYGKDLTEARTMAKDAISLYLEDLEAEGESIPTFLDTLLGSVEVETARVYA